MRKPKDPHAYFHCVDGPNLRSFLYPWGIIVKPLFAKYS